MTKELKKLAKQPPPGISAVPAKDSIRQIEVQLQGPTDSPFEAGLFKLMITVPDRYPFEPPKVQFITPVYHPNIDAQGRICLDYLNMPPKGCWGPAMDLYKVLVAIRQLLAEPNPKDPLVVDIAEEYDSQPEVFKAKARQHVALHATPQAAVATAGLEDAANHSSKQEAATSAEWSSLEHLQEGREPDSTTRSQPHASDKTHQTPLQQK